MNKIGSWKNYFELIDGKWMPKILPLPFPQKVDWEKYYRLYDKFFKEKKEEILPNHNPENHIIPNRQKIDEYADYMAKLNLFKTQED